MQAGRRVIEAHFGRDFTRDVVTRVNKAEARYRQVLAMGSCNHRAAPGPGGRQGDHVLQAEQRVMA